MLKFDERLYEILLVCDNVGKIRKIVYNSLNLGIFPIIGQSILKLSEEESKASLLNCMYLAIDFNQSTQCEVNFIIGKKRYLKSVAAKRLDSKHLLVGMLSTSKTMDMYEDMMKINNESINELRSLAKQAAIKKIDGYIQTTSDISKESMLNELSMSNYLQLIKEKKYNTDFIESLGNIINIARLVGEYKDLKITFIPTRKYGYISYEDGLVVEVFNCLISCVVKYASYGSKIDIDIGEFQNSIILEIQFRPQNKYNNFMKEEEFLLIQEIIESKQGLLWYREEIEKITLYVLDPSLELIQCESYI